jgi:fumarate reductase iron-sulfur subunit
MDTYYVEETDAMTLFIALTRIREEQGPSLMFDFMCRAGICGSSAMMINGKPDLQATPRQTSCQVRSPWCPCPFSNSSETSKSIPEPGSGT